MALAVETKLDETLVPLLPQMPPPFGSYTFGAIEVEVVVISQRNG